VLNPDRQSRGISRATLDGRAVDPAAVPLVDDGILHQVHIVMGSPAE